MRPITAWQCIVGAWRDSVRAIERMPALFFVVALISFGMFYVLHVFHVAAHISAKAGTPSSSVLNSPYVTSFVRHLTGIVDTAIAIPVIRSALLGKAFEISVSDVKVYGRYFTFWIAFVILEVAVLSLIPLAQLIFSAAGVVGSTKGAAILTVRALLISSAAYVFARSALVFPHIALGGRVNWRAAWRDTRGHFWEVACVIGMASMLPSYFVSYVVVLFVRQHPLSLNFDLASEAVVKVFALTLSAASLAWLYKRFAKDIKNTMPPEAA